jgi:uncharacterized protein YndB with AHSA1/START domain
MAARTATHGTFTLERVYDVAPARVFKAWADSAIKARWFVGPHRSWGAIDFASAVRAPAAKGKASLDRCRLPRHRAG